MLPDPDAPAKAPMPLGVTIALTMGPMRGRPMAATRPTLRSMAVVTLKLVMLRLKAPGFVMLARIKTCAAPPVADSGS